VDFLIRLDISLNTELIKYLPKLLKEDFGIELENGLKRDYVEVSPKRYEEINIIR